MTYIAEYKCGCTDEGPRKRELLDYCGKHGDSRRRIYTVPLPPVSRAPADRATANRQEG